MPFSLFKRRRRNTSAPAAPPAPPSVPRATVRTGSGSAVSLDKIEREAPGLVSLYKAAGVSLEKHRLAGVRAAVYLVLDRSGSMTSFYRDGSVQSLAERVLAAAAHFDDDGVVPVVFFDSKAHKVQEISLSDYQGRIGKLHQSLGHMGTTNYVAAMEAVINHYEDCGATDPAYVVFQTDGAPNNAKHAEKVLCKAAGLPIFWQFVGFGKDDFKFLHRLDELPAPRYRVVDNAGFFEAGPDPRRMSDETLYDQLMIEFPEWLQSARRAGVLR
ncbi:vWA domain-containing protein [Yinghuangia seranimata]|uniref:vWA domain-containing protein n=1 Tax=Yinghuangia seranimata TaxID=408067 RepID=UPI00248BD480|nr:VWA domain-containing protein [Yinghuangia seranimata]MDI2132098.1 VWA domain-containing protein [Yinghuangia seranimata]